MVKLIIIRGASGSGKSTIGKGVANKLGKKTAYINVDITPHEMMVDYINIPIDERLKFMYLNAKTLIQNFLSNGYTVVTDGLYSIEEDFSLLKETIKLGKKFGTQVFVFELDVRLEDIQKRSKERSRDEDILSDFKLVKKRYESFQKARYKDAIVIDTNNLTVDRIVNEIIKTIKN